jgi:hypothetical protein
MRRRLFFVVSSISTRNLSFTKQTRWIFRLAIRDIVRELVLEPANQSTYMGMVRRFCIFRDSGTFGDINTAVQFYPVSGYLIDRLTVANYGTDLNR